MLRYRWPGNIRELKNVFEAMFALSDGNRIDGSLLPPHIADTTVDAVLARGEVTPAMAAGRLAEMERTAINAAVASSHGNLSMAARTLGISRSTLYVKLAAMREVAVTKLPSPP
jgi:transcriptional regulator of acetoin/glycerol metabolism